ncbi:MAG: TldD/PmbA family protein [Armatimonadetes bacterium]|nr:TldD/PmbA family protein [Armatimonadota bacterium]
MPLTDDEARAILDKTTALSRADEMEVSLHSGVQGHLRFACNDPTTSGQADETRLHVTSVFGKQVGSISTTDLSDAGLQSAVQRAEDAARIAPESPEYMPRLGPQEYLAPPEWDEATARAAPDTRAAVAAEALRGARAQGVTAAGYLEDGHTLYALANTRGLRASHRATRASYSLTMRTEGGAGSGWAAAESFRLADADIDGRQIAARAMEKALRSQNPVTLEPGAYPAVLEPSAAADQVAYFLWSLNRRPADEGRSYFSDKEAGTKLGQKLFGDNITISSDPTHPLVPSLPWGEDGQPLAPRVWVQNGRLQNMIVSRYWAGQKGIAPVPGPSNLIMEGEERTLDELIAATDYGLLVTCFWYIRGVDPRTLLNTGLTRDGLFLIEGGRITRPVVNFRWNESPAALLAGVEMMSRPERAVGRETGCTALVPALKVRAFHFTSVSPSS